jgi:hypothetical protein
LWRKSDVQDFLEEFWIYMKYASTQKQLITS